MVAAVLRVYISYAIIFVTLKVKMTSVEFIIEERILDGTLDYVGETSGMGEVNERCVQKVLIWRFPSLQMLKVLFF